MIARAFPIYASKGKSLDYYLEYIINPAKVLPETDPALHNLQNQLPDTVLQEILTTEDGQAILAYVSGYMTAPEEMIERVEYLQEVYQSYHGDARGMRGPIAYHIIVSAAPTERASDQEVHLIAVELAQKLGACPGVIATHIKPIWDERLGIWRGLVKHSHLVVSAFPDTVHEMPKKLNLGYRHKHLREISDRIAIEHGLQILVDADHGRSDSYYAAMQGKKGASWMEAAREALSEAVAAAKDRGDHEAKVAEAGYGLQQIGRDFLYITPEGHQVMGRKLGRAFTAERLETRWAAEREGAIDMELDEAMPHNKALYVRLPLGGRFKDAKSHYRCCLQSLARDCSEASLQSYFQRGCLYDIFDGSGRVIRRAEGQQVLDYLGVSGSWESRQELPSAVRLRRLEWHKDRIEEEANRTCERQTESAALRFDYRCRREAQARAEGREEQHKKELAWMRVLKRKEDDKPLILVAFLLLCEAVNPEFDSGLWEWGWELTEIAEIGPPDEKMQRFFDALHILQTEGISGFWDLELRRHEARQRYEQVANELAEIKIELEDFEPIFEVAWRCKKAKQAFDSYCDCVSDYDEMCRKFPDIVEAYEEAVQAARSVCMECWDDVEKMACHYSMLQVQLPMLLQAVASEYERVRKLDLARESLWLGNCYTQLKAKIRKPSLDTRIAGAEAGKAQQQKGTPIELPDLER